MKTTKQNSDNKTKTRVNKTKTAAKNSSTGVPATPTAAIPDLTAAIENINAAIADRCKHRGMSWTSQGVLAVALYAAEQKQKIPRATHPKLPT